MPDLSLPDYYTHVREITDKVTKEFKSAGCWQADPSVGKGSMPAPGRGVKVFNTHQLQTSWHRWTPFSAPVPIGTAPMWKELLTTHEYTFMEDKSILWSPASWC